MTDPITIADAEALIARDEAVTRAVARGIRRADATSMADIIVGLIPKAGAYPCKAGCGEIVKRPGTCEACSMLERTAEHNATLSNALMSIPERFRWATVAAPELAQRVARLRAAPADVDTIHKLLAFRTLTFVGASGSGKTSFACAVLRLAIDAGRYGASERAHFFARGARFYAARDLGGGERLGREEAPAAEKAARASILLVDDVGQEAGTGETYRGSDRARSIANLLSDRHDRDAQTIVTTYGRQTQWAEWYGDGLARRYFEGDGVRVIDLEKAARKAA